jgi:hypothetical protein
LIIIGLILVVFALAACNDPLTVAQVWERAEELEGQRIRVRGKPYLTFEPHHPMQVGGCSLDRELVDRSHIVGTQHLLDEEAPDFDRLLSISPSTLQCEGNLCNLECRPFEPVCGPGAGCWELVSSPVQAFQFVGTLRINRQMDGTELVLENVDLGASQRLIDGTWSPIPTGVFRYAFP